MSEERLDTFINVTPTQCKEYLRWCINRKHTFWIHGSPGTAKSYIAAAVAKEMNLQFRDDRLSTMDSVDLRGLLDLDRKAGVSRWLPPADFPTDNDPPGLWFLDEYPDAAPEVLKASYQLVHDRGLGNYKVPDHWAIGAAGNLITDMSMVGRTPAALNNRFCHLYVAPEIKDWTETAAIPQGFHPMVIAFLNWKPTWLHAFHDDTLTRSELIQLIRNSDAWYSCRTWEYVSDIVWDYGTKKEQIKAAFPLIAGYIGLAAATEFNGYVQYYSQLPDIDELLKNPNAYQIPSETAVQWALCTATAIKITADNLENVMRFAHKLPDEMQAGMIIAAYRRDPTITDSEAFAKWSIKQDVNLF
jgi:hypothetical protein